MSNDVSSIESNYLHNDQVQVLTPEQIHHHWQVIKQQKKEWETKQKMAGHMHTPYLDFFSTNLNQKVSKHHDTQYAVGRQNKVDRISQIFMRTTKNAPVLIGPAGVGKTDIVEGFADAINKGQVPDLLKNYTVHTLNLGLMNNNFRTGQAGYFNSNLTHVLQECHKYEDRIILFIDEIHMIMGASKTSSASGMDSSQILKQPLGRGEIKLIGATTEDEFYDYVLPDRAMQRRLSPIHIKSPNKKVTFEILKQNLKDKKKHFGVDMPTDVLHLVVELADRYIPDRFMPDKAFDVLEDTYVQAYIHHHKEATKDDALWAIYGITQIPLSTVKTALQPQIASLGKIMHKYIKGQPQAIKTVENAINTAFTNFNDPKKPLASFLFLGPTGTGKTEMAKVLAKALFGNPNHMIRLDMASYNTSDAVEKLIGKNNKRGALTEAVRRQPYGILLLDEIEKASPDVWDLLLSILDDGEIQDSRGRTVDFKNEIIILTSNLAYRQIEEHDAFKPTSKIGDEEKKYLHKLFSTLIESALRRTFRPELVNRLSNRVVFDVLHFSTLVQITHKDIDILLKRMHKQNYDMTFDSATISYLTALGYNPRDGARPLQRVLHQNIIGPISTKIIQMRASDKWRSEGQFLRTWVITTTGKPRSKYDNWGTRQIHIHVRRKPLTDDEKRKRSAIFSKENIQKMGRPHNQAPQQGVKNVIKSRIRDLDRKRSSQTF